MWEVPNGLCVLCVIVSWTQITVAKQRYIDNVLEGVTKVAIRFEEEHHQYHAMDDVQAAGKASECGSVDYHVGAAEGMRDSMDTGVGVGHFKFSVLLNRQHRAAINAQRQHMWQCLGSSVTQLA